MLIAVSFVEESFAMSVIAGGFTNTTMINQIQLVLSQDFNKRFRNKDPHTLALAWAWRNLESIKQQPDKSSMLSSEDLSFVVRVIKLNDMLFLFFTLS